MDGPKHRCRAACCCSASRGDPALRALPPGARIRARLRLRESLPLRNPGGRGSAALARAASPRSRRWQIRSCWCACRSATATRSARRSTRAAQARRSACARSVPGGALLAALALGDRSGLGLRARGRLRAPRPRAPALGVRPAPRAGGRARLRSGARLLRRVTALAARFDTARSARVRSPCSRRCVYALQPASACPCSAPSRCSRRPRCALATRAQRTRLPSAGRRRALRARARAAGAVRGECAALVRRLCRADRGRAAARRPGRAACARWLDVAASHHGVGVGRDGADRGLARPAGCAARADCECARRAVDGCRAAAGGAGGGGRGARAAVGRRRSRACARPHASETSTLDAGRWSSAVALSPAGSAPSPLRLIAGSQHRALRSASCAARALRCVGASALALGLAWAPPAALSPARAAASWRSTSAQATRCSCRGATGSLLVDAGPALPGRFDRGRDAVLPALACARRRAPRPGGREPRGSRPSRRPAQPCSSALPVGALWMPQPAARTIRASRSCWPPRGHAQIAVHERGRHGSALQLGDLRVVPLWPADGQGARNERSLALRVEVGRHRLLLLGDLGKAETAAAGARRCAARRRAGVASSRQPRLVERARCWPPCSREVAIVSAPCRGRLPHPAALARARRAGASLWWTGRDGAVSLALGETARRAALRDTASGLRAARGGLALPDLARLRLAARRPPSARPAGPRARSARAPGTCGRGVPRAASGSGSGVAPARCEQRIEQRAERVEPAVRAREQRARVELVAAQTHACAAARPEISVQLSSRSIRMHGLARPCRAPRRRAMPSTRESSTLRSRCASDRPSASSGAAPPRCTSARGSAGLRGGRRPRLDSDRSRGAGCRAAAASREGAAGGASAGAGCGLAGGSGSRCRGGPAVARRASVERLRVGAGQPQASRPNSLGAGSARGQRDRLGVGQALRERSCCRR